MAKAMSIYQVRGPAAPMKNFPHRSTTVKEVVSMSISTIIRLPPPKKVRQGHIDW